MDFHNLATSEASSLVERLLARQSAATLEQLATLRQAIDAASQALAGIPRVDGDLGELAARLTGARDAELQHVRGEARAAIEAAHGEIAAQVAQIEQLRAVIVQADAETALLRSELQTAQERAESADRDLEATLEAHAALESAIRGLEADAQRAAEAGATADAQLADARAAIDLMLTETEQLRAQCERDAAERSAMQELARASGSDREAIQVELEGARAHVRALEADLEHARATRDERDALAAQLRTLETRLHGLEYELAGAAEAREQRDAITTQLEASTARVQALEAAHAAQDERIHALQAQLDAAATIEARLRADARTARAAGAGPGGEEAEVLRGEVERMVSLFDASARAVGEMAAAGSSGELLTELVKRLSLQFSRVALFRLKGNRLEGEHQVGFDEQADMSKLVIPTNVDSMLTRAVTSGVVQSLAGDDVAVRSGTPFGGTPTSAVALPIVLQGTTLAVVYADDSDMPESARGPAVHESSVGFARLLAGQVIVLLVRHTHELKTLAELSQYATTLLQEAKEMYLADAQAGKNPDLLRSRLKENIDCASQLYAYRAAMEGTTAAALLDEQIAAEIETSTPFAQDLAIVVRQMQSNDVQLTAEAS
jgi:chromosome segregation ATPase